MVQVYILFGQQKSADGDANLPQLRNQKNCSCLNIQPSVVNRLFLLCFEEKVFSPTTCLIPNNMDTFPSRHVVGVKLFCEHMWNRFDTCASERN